MMKPRSARVKRRKQLLAADIGERYYAASQSQLIWRHFRRHKLAMVGLVILVVLYTLAMFCEFFSPHDPLQRFPDYIYAPPQRVRMIDTDGRFHLRPFVYGYERERNPETLRLEFRPDTAVRHPIRLFVRGRPYRVLGVIQADLRLLGVEDGPFFLFGTDRLGRDLFTRNLHASRVSLSIGLVGIVFSFVLGCILGGISGYYGGTIDIIVQRIIEVLLSIPTIPLWMALSAALPAYWSSIQAYFGITIILSVIGWTGLARVVRGKLLELREEDFVMAARLCGVRERTIISRHMLPSFMSYLIVDMTLRVPHMILGETSLSFLGLGIRPPAISWGVLLEGAQNVRTVLQSPWLLIPGAFVVVTVLAFSFVGDGLRDAADPYKS